MAARSPAAQPVERILAASMNPDHMVPLYDILNELKTNREDYLGSEWLSLYGFPAYIKTCIDGVRKKVKSGGNPPGFSPASACCLAYGIGTLTTHPAIRALLDLKTAVDTAENVDPDELEELAGFLRNFPLSLPNATTSGNIRRHNIVLPEKVKTDLSELSGELGTHISTLALICMAVALHDQPSLLGGYRKDLTMAVEKFIKRVVLRHNSARRWYSQIKKGGPVELTFD